MSEVTQGVGAHACSTGIDNVLVFSVVVASVPHGFVVHHAVGVTVEDRCKNLTGKAHFADSFVHFCLIDRFAAGLIGLDGFGLQVVDVEFLTWLVGFYNRSGLGIVRIAPEQSHHRNTVAVVIAGYHFLYFFLSRRCRNQKEERKSGNEDFLDHKSYLFEIISGNAVSLYPRRYSSAHAPMRNMVP